MLRSQSGLYETMKRINEELNAGYHHLVGGGGGRRDRCMDVKQCHSSPKNCETKQKCRWGKKMNERRR